MLRQKREATLTGFDTASGTRVDVNASLPVPTHERPILSENQGIVFPRILLIPGTGEVYGVDGFFSLTHDAHVARTAATQDVTPRRRNHVDFIPIS